MLIASRPFLSQQRPTKDLPDGDSATWSTFAADRHVPGTGNSYFEGSQAELLQLVRDHWKERTPGTGRTNLEEVVKVPVPADHFMTTTVEVTPKTRLEARFDKRREYEEPYLRVSAHAPAEPARFAEVVLYSHDTLAKNNEATSNADWEVVSLVASPVKDEPMSPVTMMRNMREKPGGTKVTYTADQLLDSIEFWSHHAKADGRP